MNKLQAAKSCTEPVSHHHRYPRQAQLQAGTQVAPVGATLSAVAIAYDIRRSGTFVGRIFHPGFEIDGLLDQTRGNVGVRDGMREFQKRYCLLRQILFAHH
jgi:hypothetical protein